MWLARFESSDKPDPSLPDVVDLNDEALAKQVYLLEETFADGNGTWRFLPSQLLAENEALMDDLVTLRWLAGKVRAANDTQ